MDTYLCIADLLVVVRSDSVDDAPISLQSNYAPFITQRMNDYPLLYEFVIDEHFDFESNRKELRRYQSEYSSCVVYETENHHYQFESFNSLGLLYKLQTDKDFRFFTVSLFGTLLERERSFNNAMMMSFALAIALRDGFMIHASAISCEGHGYLFLGKSGTGKSTHSQLWLNKFDDCELMNDDNPIVRMDNDKAVVYGSPWSGKTPCYKSLNAFVGGVVLLEQKKHNVIRRMSVVEAFSTLLVSCSFMHWDERMLDCVYGNVSKFLDKSHFYHLECLPNEEAAVLCRKTIEL